MKDKDIASLLYWSWAVTEPLEREDSSYLECLPGFFLAFVSFCIMCEMLFGWNPVVLIEPLLN